ncbi:hypothetical protein [Burkholderia gladioli]|uniref:hypothetical protein n=1 Tax=Burkholderia gladioli TaxID=28095 RepID=UPI00163F2BBB|nr:hypothetical protein [Burkholderia gladioli]
MNDMTTTSRRTCANPIVETWRATVWGIGHHAFLVDVHADQTWRITRIGLQRLGDYELVEFARGGPSVAFEVEVRAALARYRGTITLRRDSPIERRQRWAIRGGDAATTDG